MASYTDKAPTFNPYVAQQPVEAMLKVGMAKQAQYQQGYEKIQSSIDRVAGLELYRDVDKAHMQTKLNELGTKLRTVAAGDFSNFQLTNSVAGMASTISNDKIVQAGVMSTARIKSENNKREELEKKGLTDVNNDIYYAKDLNAYANNTELTGPDGKPIIFSGEYTPYTDINKKLKEAMVGIGENESVIEDIFVTDKKGNPMVFSDGLHYADVKKVTTLVNNKEQVASTIQMVLSQGNVRKQLQIDGYATYKDVPAAALLPSLEKNYKERENFINEQELGYTGLLGAKNLTEEDRKDFSKILIQLDADKKNNVSVYNNLVEASISSPDSFKENLYAQQYTNLATARYTKDKNNVTHETNPGKQQENWETKMQFDYTQERNKIAYQNQTLNLARDSHALAREKFNADTFIDENGVRVTRTSSNSKTANNKKIISTDDPSFFKAGTSGEPILPSSIMAEDVTKITEERNTLAFKMYVDLMRKKTDNPNLSKKQIQDEINIYARANKMTPEAYVNSWAERMQNKYAEFGLTPNKATAAEFDLHNSMQRELADKKNIDTTAKTSAYKEANVSKVAMNALNKIEDINIVDGENSFKLSKEGLLGLVSRSDVINTGKGVRLSFFNKDNKEPLTKEQQAALNKINKLSYTKKTEFFDKFNFAKENTKEYTATIKKATALYNEKLSVTTGVTDNIGGAVLMVTEDGAKPTTERLSAYATEGKRSYIGGKEEDFIAAINDAAGVSWNAKKPTRTGEDWTGSITVVPKNGGPKITLTDLSRADLELLSNQTFSKYTNTPIADALLINNTHTTNSKYYDTNPEAWKGTRFKTGDFSEEIRKANYTIHADAVAAPGGSSFIYYIKPEKAAKFTKIYGNEVFPNESIIPTMLKTMTVPELEYMLKQANTPKK